MAEMTNLGGTDDVGNIQVTLMLLDKPITRIAGNFP